MARESRVNPCCRYALMTTMMMMMMMMMISYRLSLATNALKLTPIFFFYYTGPMTSNFASVQKESAYCARKDLPQSRDDLPIHNSDQIFVDKKRMFTDVE